MATDVCVCFSTMATIANILQFSYFPSWPFLWLFLFVRLFFPIALHSFGLWKGFYFSVACLFPLTRTCKRPRAHHAWVPLPAAPKICCNWVYIHHLLPSSPYISSSTAPCEQHSAMKIDRSWRELSAVFTAFAAIFICATFRRPSAARCAASPAFPLLHSGCRLIWKIAPNICEAWRKKRQMLKVAPALIVRICQYC